MSNRPRRPLSLAFRLTLFISMTAVTTFLLFSLFVIHSVKQHFEEMDINELRQVSANIQQIVANHEESESERQDRIIQAVAGHGNIFISLTNSRHEILYQTPESAFLKGLAHGVPTVERLDIATMATRYAQPLDNGLHPIQATPLTAFRIAVLSIPTENNQGNDTLTIALAIDFHLHYIQSLTSNLLLVAMVACLIIVFIARLAVYQGHAPLRKASKKIASITAKSLHARLRPDSVPIELAQLVISFNTMIEQIEDVFKRQSHFSADIAHELRTPITNLLTQTQIILAQPRRAEDYREVLYSNLEEYERLAKMVGDMLFLAQADNRLLIPEMDEIDLKKEVAAVFDYFEAWAEERGISLRAQGDVLPIYGDRLMLRRVFNNLLSNAIRYTADNNTVNVIFSQTPSQAQIIVENQGVPIAAEHLPRLFDRFYRVEQSRQQKGDGSGIGLAIVKSIIDAHKGDITATSDRHATRFIITLPTDAGELGRHALGG